MKHVFVTGATGCVGHYVVERLLERPDVMLHLLVRDPARMRLALKHERVTLIPGDMLEIDRQAERLSEMDAVVHLATAWGDPVAYDINVAATHAMFRHALSGRCRRVLYFSTASILGSDNLPLTAADRLGTDYIRSKYLAYQGLADLPRREAVVTMFPTLIFGGGPEHPVSHLSRGLEQVLRYLWLLRYFRLDGSLHFIHADDIARMVAHLIDAPAPAADLVLGNAPTTVDEVLDALCEVYALPRERTLDLAPVAAAVARLAGKRMTDWDRFCLEQRHFRYQAVNPRALGLAPGIETLHDVVALRSPQHSREG